MKIAQNAEAFIELLEQIHDVDDQIYHVYYTVDVWFKNGWFAEYDRVLGIVLDRFRTYDICTMLALLVSARLASRQEAQLLFLNAKPYATALRAHLEQVRPNDVEGLLRGLE